MGYWIKGWVDGWTDGWVDLTERKRKAGCMPKERKERKMGNEKKNGFYL